MRFRTIGTMLGRTMLGLLAGLGFLVGPAAAQNCAGSFPTTLANGTNADATQVMANLTYLLNCINNLPAPTAAATISSPRQTVSAGPVTTAGLPSFLPATAGSLSLTTQNVSGAAPLAVTAANNVDATTGAQKDLMGVTTSNLTWSSLTASSTLYLYVTVATNGTLTTGFTSQAPVYQWGGTPATTNGLFTFNIVEMRGYLGNGSTAPQAYVVFLGEAVTSGSAVTSAVAYTYNGRYDSGWTATLPAASTKTSRSHNIGSIPGVGGVVFECTTADGGVAVGEQVKLGESVWTFDGSYLRAPSITAATRTLAFTSASASGSQWSSINATTGAAFALTASNWKYKLVANRGW
jgi:hypothetical protein